MKKYLALILATCFVICLFGCSNGINEQYNNGETENLHNNTTNSPSTTIYSETSDIEETAKNIETTSSQVQKDDYDESDIEHSIYYDIFNKEGQIEETVLVDTDLTKIIAKNLEYGDEYVYLNLEIENKSSDETLGFASCNNDGYDTSINNIDMPVGEMDSTDLFFKKIDVNPNEKIECRMVLQAYADLTLLYGVTEIANFTIGFKIMQGLWTIKKIANISIETSLLESHDYDKNWNEYAVKKLSNNKKCDFNVYGLNINGDFDDSDVLIKYAYTIESKETDMQWIILRLKNTSEKPKLLTLKNVIFDDIISLNIFSPYEIKANSYCIYVLKIDQLKNHFPPNFFGNAKIRDIFFDFRIETNQNAYKIFNDDYDKIKEWEQNNIFDKTISTTTKNKKQTISTQNIYKDKDVKIDYAGYHANNDDFYLSLWLLIKNDSSKYIHSLAIGCEPPSGHEDNAAINNNEIYLYDNITIQNTNGKYQVYYIFIDSYSLHCSDVYQFDELQEIDLYFDKYDTYEEINALPLGQYPHTCDEFTLKFTFADNVSLNVDAE